MASVPRGAQHPKVENAALFTFSVYFLERETEACRTGLTQGSPRLRAALPHPSAHTSLAQAQRLTADTSHSSPMALSPCRGGDGGRGVEGWGAGEAVWLRKLPWGVG